METLPNASIEKELVEKEKTLTCNKLIITNLIKQDLINWKMIHSLQKVQVRADDYQFDIGSIIFEMMNLEDRKDVDEIFEKYVEMSKPILKLPASQSNKKNDLLASKIYYYLKQCSQNEY